MYHSSDDCQYSLNGGIVFVRNDSGQVSDTGSSNTVFLMVCDTEFTGGKEKTGDLGKSIQFTYGSCDVYGKLLCRSG